MRDLHLEEYKDYLVTLRNSIWQILPLYEKKNPYIKKCVHNLERELSHVLSIIEPLPHGAWYFSTHASLQELLDLVEYEGNHSRIREKILNTTSLIQQQIENLEV